MPNRKGKEKAIEPVQVPIDSDTDSDIDFFTAKRTYVRPLPAVASEREISPEITYEVSTDYDEDGRSHDGAKRRRRKIKRQRQKKVLPDWTRGSSSTHIQADRLLHAHSDLGNRKGDDDVVIVLSDDSEPRSPRKTRDIELTPPPEIPTEKKEEIKRALDKHLVNEVSVTQTSRSAPESSSDISSSSSPPLTDLGPDVLIQVKMMADPVIASAASVTALKHYERTRIFTISRHESLRKLVEALADRIEKLPEDIVLVYQKQRIFSTSRTPFQMGIMDSAEMTGYEKTLYDRLEKEKRQQRAQLLTAFNGEDAETLDEPTTVSFASVLDESRSSSALPKSEIERIRLTLRGCEGQVRFSASMKTKVATICRYYCSKLGVDLTRAHDMELIFDGESFQGDILVADMGLENGDLVDVQ